MLLETLAVTIFDIAAVPLAIVGLIIVFIIDAIIFIFNLLSMFNIFTINI